MESYSEIVNKFGAELSLPEDAIAAAANAVDRRPRAAAFFYQHNLNKGRSSLRYVGLEKRRGGAFALGATLILAARLKKEYSKLGIPDQVFWDTFSDIKLWEHNYFVTKGKHGIGELCWLKNHLRTEIFRIGRLQFQMTKTFDPVFLKALKLNAGANVLFVHIPQGEPLRSDAARQSFIGAKDFFARYFPAFSYRYMITESWLLYGKNREFMREDSNILKFSRLFRFIADKKQPAEAEKRIFGEEYNRAARETSMQKACRAYLEGGGTLGVGCGYIDSETLSAKIFNKC